MLLGLTPAFAASNQNSASVRVQIAQAYSTVLGAEQKGGNVTSLVATLNNAISLVQEADSVNSTNPARAQALYAQASSIVQQVLQGSPAVATAGAAAAQNAGLALAIETAVLVALAVLAYLYTPRVFWTLWYRAHRGWRVSKK